jgi:hypothetical protein
MHRNRIVAALAVLGLVALVGFSPAADSPLDSLKSGEPTLKSAGAMTFGPDGILFIGDNASAAIYAIDTGDRKADGDGKPKVTGIDGKIASLLGIETSQLAINDLAVNPLSGNVYLAVSRGKGPDAKPVIVKVTRDGKVSELALKNVKFSQTALPNPATKDKARQSVITDMGYAKGKLFVAGLSSDFDSTLRVIPFPFADANKGTGIEIFHGSHGRLETASPIRTFVPYEIGGEAHLLAAYTCTPLVKVPVADLKPGQKIKGTTIAELGKMNAPLDMLVYSKGGKDYLLLANNNRGLMKIPLETAGKADPITTRAADKTGIQYETLTAYKNNVVHLDKLDNGHAIILTKDADGMSLETIDLP